MKILKSISTWWNSGYIESGNKEVKEYAKHSFIIVRVYKEDGTWYDSIEHNGVRITIEQDSPTITDRLAELQSAYITANLKSL